MKRKPELIVTSKPDDLRRVIYVGDHPWLRGRGGVTYLDLYRDCDLFRPDDGKGAGEWFRVWLDNLIRDF